MDVLTFIVRMVEALVWPMVVAFLLWYSRAHIGGLFHRLEKFKGWGAEVSFLGQQLDRLEAALPEPQLEAAKLTDPVSSQAHTAEAEPPSALPASPSNEGEAERPSGPPSDKNAGLRLGSGSGSGSIYVQRVVGRHNFPPLFASDLPPAYLVDDAWKRVEGALRIAGNRLIALGDDWSKAFRELPDRLGLLPEEKESLIELREMRNQVVHSLDPQITTTDALRYHDIADRLVQAIKERSRSLEP